MKNILLILFALPLFVSGQHHMMHTLAGQSTDGFTSTPWDITNLVLEDSLDVSSKIPGTNYSPDLFLSDDGIYLSVSMSTGEVFRYNLGISWSISSASYSHYNSLAANRNRNITSNPTGTKYYGVSDSIVQTNLSTAWNLSTKVYYKGFYVYLQNAYHSGISIKQSDGTKVYLIGSSGTDEINLYTMSTGWDLKTISYTSVTTLVNTYETNNTGIFVRQDTGNSIYTIGLVNDKIHRFSTTAAWSLTGIAHVASSVDLKTISYITAPTGIFFHPDGTKVYVIDDVRRKIYQFKLGY